MTNVVVVGSQWGDEGKGKIVDWLSERADVVVRYQGLSSMASATSFRFCRPASCVPASSPSSAMASWSIRMR
jgi:hypothetical protein